MSCTGRFPTHLVWQEQASHKTPALGKPFWIIQIASAYNSDTRFFMRQQVISYYISTIVAVLSNCLQKIHTWNYPVHTRFSTVQTRFWRVGRNRHLYNFYFLYTFAATKDSARSIYFNVINNNNKQWQTKNSFMSLIPLSLL